MEQKGTENISKEEPPVFAETRKKDALKQFKKYVISFLMCHGFQ